MMIKKIIIVFLALLLVGCIASHEPAVQNQNTSTLVDADMIESINNYLLSQRDFAWQTREGGKNFCTFYPFNSIDESEIYVWVRCSEFRFNNGALEEMSGMSGPAKLVYPPELSFFDHTKFSHVVPRDGSLYSRDIEKIFPKEIRDEMDRDKKTVLVNLNSELIEKAARYFNVEDFSEVPNSFVQHCQEDSDCITPFNYSIRSDCPYKSKCVAGGCEVVCEYR